MRRTTTRARRTTGLAALTTALLVVGTTGAQAAPNTAATPARTAASTTAQPAQTPQTSRARRLPTAALHRIGAGPTDRTVVTVRFKAGVRAASVAGAAPLAVGARRFAAAPRSVAPSTNAATYSVDPADADGFVAAMKSRTDVLDAAPEVFGHYDALPDDTAYGTQAAYLDLVNAAPAWDYGQGSSAVKVAIIDSGMDVGHPDLAAKVAPADRWNTFSNTTNVTDTVGHGTFVAGVAAAATNNATGVAGTGWNSSLMAVKVADGSGGLALTDVAEGIVWAADHGAKVINLSLGFLTGSTALANAVKHAQSAGALVVASAGNSAQEGNPRMYPAAYPGVVSVGATDGSLRAWFSETGSWVTMAAPGVNITSTTVRAGSLFWPAGEYSTGDGTSFSAPMVAGAAALVWGRSPGATNTQVRAAVVNSAHGFSGYGLGKGRLDMLAAMKAIVPSTAPTIVSPADGSTVTRPFDLFAQTGLPNAGAGTKVAWRLDGALQGYSVGDGPRAIDLAGYAQGTHTIEARLCNASQVCAPTGTTSTFTLDAPAPTIDPTLDGTTVTGPTQVAVTVPSGDAVALFDGTTRVGFAGVFAGGLVELNLSGVTGPRTLQAVLCNASGSRCDGARSVPVTVTSEFAAVTKGGTTNPLLSPDGNGVKDTTSVTYTTSGTQTVVTKVMLGGFEVRSTAAVSRPAGTYTFTWDGKDAAGTPVGASAYQLRVETTDAAGHQGLVTSDVLVDGLAPTAVVRPGYATTFYPVVDGYQDTFVPSFHTDEAATVSFAVKNAAGTTVRTLTRSVAANAQTTFSWNGRNAAGTLQPAGTYKWTLTATDASGRSRTTTARSLALKRTKLTTRTATLTKKGTGAFGVNAGPACARVTTAGTSYASGLWLKNTCAKGSTGESTAWFHLTAPAAVKYTGYTIRTTGRSHSAPVDLEAGLLSSQTSFFDVTWPVVRVPSGATTTRTLNLGTLRTGGHGRTVTLIVFASNARLAPLTDWDIKTVSVTVTYQVLA